MDGVYEMKLSTRKLFGSVLKVRERTRWLGFKVIKEKEAGDLKSPTGPLKPMRGPEGPPPTSS